MEIFEIKRKVFEVEQRLGERSYIVNRKGKKYFLKDFENDKKGFNEYIESETALNKTGIAHPRIYAYDKNICVVASEYIEGSTVCDDLIKKDLPEEYFELVFKANWFVKKEKITIDYNPRLWKLNNGKLYYLGEVCKKFEENSSFEKVSIRLWFYSKEFAKFLVQNSLPVDRSRVPDSDGVTNKKMVLMVVKYYI